MKDDLRYIIDLAQELMEQLEDDDELDEETKGMLLSCFDEIESYASDALRVLKN